MGASEPKAETTRLAEAPPASGKPSKPSKSAWSGAAWLSTFISLLIIAAFASFFVLRYQQVRSSVFERSVRLLVTGGEALRHAGGENAKLRLGQEGCQDGVRVESPAPNGREPNKPCVSFQQLLSFIPKSKQVFDKTLLLGKGEVVLEQTSTASAPNLLSLADLTLIGADGKALGPASKASEIKPARLVEAGSEQYHLFCQPLTKAALDASDAKSPLVLCGLISEARLLRDCLSMSPLYVLLLAGLLSLVLLVPPFLKTRLLGFTQRVRFFEAFTVGLCLLFWLMLLTLMGEGFYTHASLRTASSEQLEALSQVVAKNLNDDLVAGKKALLELNDANIPIDPPPPKLRQPRTLPELEAVAALDDAGLQLAKWVSPAMTDQGREPDLLADAKLADVSARPYFKRIRRAPVGTVLVDSIKTYTSGQTRAVLALRREARDGVLTLTLHPKALRAARLPRGIGFAVVNRAGWAVFHADESLSNSHNLLDEAESNTELKHALLSGEAAFIQDFRYFGLDHYAHVRSMPDGGPSDGWSVITFQESEPVRLVAFHAVVTSLLYSAGYAGICVLLLLLYLLVSSGRVTWLWPDKCRTVTYWLLAILQLGVGIVAFLTAWVGRMYWKGTPLLVSLLLPAALALVGIVSFELELQVPRLFGLRAKLDDWLHKPGAHWFAYAVSFSVFWVVSTFVPTHAIARGNADSLLEDFGREQMAGWNEAQVALSTQFPGSDVSALLDEYCRVWGNAATQLGFDQLLRHLGSWAPGLVFGVSCLAAAGMVPWGMRILYLWGVEAVERHELPSTLNEQTWLVVGAEAIEHHGLHHVLDADDFAALVSEGGAVPLHVSSPRTPEEMLELAPPQLRRKWFEALRRYRVAYVREAAPDPSDVTEQARLMLGLGPQPAAPAQTKEAASVRRRLQRVFLELRDSPQVLAACQKNLAAAALSGVDDAETLRRLRDACWGYYTELWQGCSRLEKLTLVQLAEERFINDKRIEIVRRLLARGLIRRRPNLAPLNDSFALFVRDLGADEDIAQYEEAPDGFSWDHLRAPLFTLFVCSAAAFFYTQRALYDTTLVFATSITGVLPHLGGLLAATGLSGAKRVAKSAAEALGA